MKLTREKLRRLIISEMSSIMRPGDYDEDSDTEDDFSPDYRIMGDTGEFYNLPRAASIQSSARYVEIYDVDVSELEEPVAPIATIDHNLKDLENTPVYDERQIEVFSQLKSIFSQLRSEGYESVYRIHEGDYVDISAVISDPSMVLNLGNMF